MNETIRKLIASLSESPTKLDKSTVEKIHRYIPVPTDYKILWADIDSFGGYPAGVVITDRAIIMKASRKDVKNSRKQIKQENKKIPSKEKLKVPKVIYRIILWEYYTPEDYDVLEQKDDKGHIHYVFKLSTSESVQFSSGSLYSMFLAYKTEAINARKAAEATFSAINTVNVEGVMFNAAYGADQTRTGHGIYAEEAGSILDRLAGEQSTVVGRDNAKNGPDKIVDAFPIQCKYHMDASKSVQACFGRDPHTGMMKYRYKDLNGNPAKVEVPSDQYIQAIEFMKKRILAGQVENITDPNAAYDIIRKGKLTYNQAKNLAKAGTIESLEFDIYTGAINGIPAFGISTLVSFAQTYWTTKNYKTAAKSAIITGVQVYTNAFVGGIIASQVARTGLTSAISPLTTEITKSLSPKTIQAMINSYRALAGKRAIYGSAAQKSFAKFATSTAITQTVMLMLYSAPDTYNAISGKISGAQYWKNMTSLIASFSGSIVSTTATGIAIGRIQGEKVNKKAGAVIGMGAGAVGGAISGTVAHSIGNIFREDDALIMARLFQCVFSNQVYEYMLNGEELDAVNNMIDNDEKQLLKLQQNLRKSETQEADIINYLKPKIIRVIKKRSNIDIATVNSMENNMQSVILNGGLNYDL